ncbi:glycoside hydrolase family 26 protein [[Clostridium] polysaccharolyticum]|uniref:Glycosyl hydrolase family 26 n=1 Tax=[Clostridium] polysaccharolyticum TaxID=29364 RepID=A0A1I0DEJ9_9FIRM|nr:hypothetical protein [[Clostridium] polysaccharolyticum]SET30450.1 Glycosyl hydrolase family 26 [[Clostridium] polysaccharolyticum]
MKKRVTKILATAVLAIAMCVSTVSASISMNDSGLKIGAWLGVQANTSEINTWQSLADYKLDTVMAYMDWSTNFNSIKNTIMDSIYNNGSQAIITWEPWGLSNTAISSGQKDSYIRQMANDMKAYNKEINISLMHEANGNWYDWAIGDSKVNTNQTYIAAYRHVVDIFRQQGAKNVKFIWNVNAGNCGSGSTYTGHYPGDAYVDYIAIDGYNWGTTQSWGSTWQSFDSIFAAPYQALCAISKPIFITEFSSTEIGGNKAAWITETFNTIRTKYPRIKLVSWFGENKETDWRINSSASALAAFKAALKAGSTAPSVAPSIKPSVAPSVAPSIKPSVAPSPSPVVNPSKAPSGNVDVKVNTTASGSVNQVYTITSNGSAVDLSKLTIRYTFQKADAKNMNVFVDNAAAQLNVAPYYTSFNSDVNTVIKKDAGNYVLELTFKNAFTLQPNTGSVQIQVRMANDDWSSIGAGFTEKDLTVLY